MAQPVPFEAGGSTGAAAGEIIAGWQHVFQILRKHPRHSLADESPVSDRPCGERETLPFIALSPFGGYYFGPR